MIFSKNTIRIVALLIYMVAQPILAGNIVIYDEPRNLPKFTLIDHDGKSFTRTALEKQWSLVFFGYTSCPDVCPMTLGVLERVMGLIKADAVVGKSKVRVIFASLDPLRDTPKILKDYIGYFGDNFIGITGENKGEIDKLTGPIGMKYDFEDAKTNEPIMNVSELSAEKEYLVNHFSGIFIIDPKARMSAVVYPPHDEKRLVKILSFIYKSYMNE